jgi:hypothetical protein
MHSHQLPLYDDSNYGDLLYTALQMFKKRKNNQLPTYDYMADVFHYPEGLFNVTLDYKLIE